MLSKKQLQEIEESRMTSKNIRAIAGELADCATDNPMWRKFGYVAGYVLATVNDDDDELITPERLMELGFVHNKEVNRLVHPVREGMLWYEYETSWNKAHFRIGGAFLVEETAPRNMGEVRQLIERCGSIKETV